MDDLFDHIKQIESGNLSYFDNLPPEEANKVSFYMLLKWMSYTKNKDQVLHINALTNTKVFSLYKHKPLLYKLFCASAIGKNTYKWIKKESKKGSNLLKLISQRHNCGLSEAEQIIELYSKDELLELVQDQNFDKTELDKYKKEINVFSM